MQTYIPQAGEQYYDPRCTEVRQYNDGLDVELYHTPNGWYGCITTEYIGHYTLVVDFMQHVNKRRLINKLRNALGGPLDLLI